MSRAANSPGSIDSTMTDAPSMLTDAASLSPLPASEAVGRTTGIGRAPLPAARAPFWQAAGIAGLIALIAAAALPLMADLLAIGM